MSKLNWVRTGKLIRQDETIIIYSCNGPYTIESRRKQIPHANGYSGTWEQTTYVVVKDGVDIKECVTLKDAKDYVEDL